MIKLKVIYQYALIAMGLLIVAAIFISCTPSIGSSGSTVESTIQTPHVTEVLSGTTVQKTSTPKATPSPLLPHPTIEISTSTPTVSRTATVVPTMVASVTPYPVHGDLFIFGAYSPFEPRYIYSLSLETSQIRYILKQEDDWQNLNAWFSPTGALATYWVETADHSELWLTPLEFWSPELVLTVPETGYNTYYVEWLAVDKYLFFQTYREILGAREPVNSYLINTVSKQIVSPPGWKGNCNIVAFSPRTNQIATWCLIENEQDTSVTYAVVEENDELWFSNDRPEQIVKERGTIGEFWSWSHDRQYFVFSDYAEPRDLLNMTNARTETTIHLDDGHSDHYDVVSLSPNNRYLAYFGNCANGEYCQLIIEIETEEVIWTSQEVTPPNRGTPLALVWSPDSRYFALWVSPEVLVIEVETGEIVMRFDDLDWVRGVWLQDK
ncbi:MAG TPA: hypothetical protein PLD25_32550 [Chloroflexota bacterium]|nr:hypothetical protein [Chloroflexota bacterium]HUM71399.1 hypothetical protein [Chloroflexota bacterium]